MSTSAGVRFGYMRQSGPQEREVIKISVLRTAMQTVREMSEEQGMKLQACFGRIVEWFSAQSPERRRAILANMSDKDIRKLADEDEERTRADAAAGPDDPRTRGINRELDDEFLENLRGTAAPRKTTKKRGA